MAFVSGLMGPYMGPIPINASMGMLISLAIALIFTPWMCRKLFASERHDARRRGARGRQIASLFRALMTPFLAGDRARTLRHRLYLGTAGAIVVAVLLAVVQLVVLKMLPFDNKSEFQVVVNMPEGTPVEGTARVLAGLANIVRHGPGSHGLPSLCRHRGAHQFQWPRSPVLSARRQQPGRSAGQSRRQARSQPQEPRHRARDSPRTRRRRQATRRSLRASRRSAARAAGAGAAGRRDLWTGLRRAGKDRACAAGHVRCDAGHRRYRRYVVRTRHPLCRRPRPGQGRPTRGLPGRGDGIARHRARGSGCHVRPFGPRARSDRRATRVGVRRQTGLAAGARPPGARHERRARAALRSGHGVRNAVGRDDLPQGSLAGGVRHRRHGRPARQPAVRHVQPGLANQQGAARGSAADAALHQSARSTRATSA